MVIDSNDKIILTGTYSSDYYPGYLNPDNPAEEYISIGATNDVFVQKYI